MRPRVVMLAGVTDGQAAGLLGVVHGAKTIHHKTGRRTQRTAGLDDGGGIGRDVPALIEHMPTMPVPLLDVGVVVRAEPAIALVAGPGDDNFERVLPGHSVAV